MKGKSEREKSAYLTLISLLFFLPVGSLLWLDYLRAPSIIFKIMSVISGITTPIGVILLYLAYNPIYDKYLEDKRNNVIKSMKPLDIFYRYVPADVVRLGLMFIYIGVSLGIVLNIKPNSELVQLFGNKTIVEVIICGPIGIAFYTLWALYCNDFSTKKGILKYVAVVILALSAMIFMIMNA